MHLGTAWWLLSTDWNSCGWTKLASWEPADAPTRLDASVVRPGWHLPAIKPVLPTRSHGRALSGHGSQLHCLDSCGKCFWFYYLQVKASWCRLHIMPSRGHLLLALHLWQCCYPCLEIEGIKINLWGNKLDACPLVSCPTVEDKYKIWCFTLGSLKSSSLFSKLVLWIPTSSS